jgi:hypothetical protein
VPNFDLTTGCDPFFDVRQGDGKLQVYNWLTAHGGRVDNYKPRTVHVVDFAVWPKNDVRVTGDTKIVFYDKDDFSEPEKMFHFWFHTSFVDREYLRLRCVAGGRPNARARSTRLPLTLPPTHPKRTHRLSARSKQVLDNAVKDKTCSHFSAAFQIEVFFEDVGEAAPVAEGQPRYLEFDADHHADDDTG